MKAAFAAALLVGTVAMVPPPHLQADKSLSAGAYDLTLAKLPPGPDNMSTIKVMVKRVGPGKVSITTQGWTWMGSDAGGHLKLMATKEKGNLALEGDLKATGGAEGSMVAKDAKGTQVAAGHFTLTPSTAPDPSAPQANTWKTWICSHVPICL